MLLSLQVKENNLLSLQGKRNPNTSLTWYKWK
jgi:hypothetical protein